MNRAAHCVAAGLSLIALSISAQAQQQTKIAKIGWLGSRLDSTLARESFKRELRALGYVEGKNIVFEYRSSAGRLDQLTALAEELVRLNVDLMIMSSTAEGLAAKKATGTIPIVLLGGGDLVADGLVDSLARPGGNITGVTNFAPALAGKRLELLKETIPKLSRVGVLWNPEGPSSVQQWKESQLAARELGLQLHSTEIRSGAEIVSAVKSAIKANSSGLAVTSSPLINTTSNQKQIADLSIKHRLPGIYNRSDFVENGGLMSYGANPFDLYRRAALYIDKILKGAKPADLPIEQPTKFELVVNLKTAKQIGLTIPPNVLARADRVIR